MLDSVKGDEDQDGSEDRWVLSMCELQSKKAVQEKARTIEEGISG